MNLAIIVGRSTTKITIMICTATFKKDGRPCTHTAKANGLCGLHDKKVPTNVDAECPICYDAIGKGGNTLGCGHSFHKGCVNRWLRSHNTCPMCRAPTSTTVAQAPQVARAPQVAQAPQVAPTVETWPRAQQLQMIENTINALLNSYTHNDIDNVTTDVMNLLNLASRLNIS